MTTMRAMIAAALVVATWGVAVAKLPPAAPLTDAQKAAAEEKKAKDAVAATAAKAQQAKAEDRVVARYIAEQKAKGIIVHPTPTAAAGTAVVTTAQGNTPAGARPGQSADAKGPAKTPSQPSAAATGPGAAKDSSKK
ncbi:MAG: hypothetical protein ABI886_03420 [Betaproteobacteria bacterium]